MISASRRSSGRFATPSSTLLTLARGPRPASPCRAARVSTAGVLQLRLRPARAVAVVVRGQVVGDADQPGPQRPAVRLALRPLEVAVGLEEGLLGEVLGVVVVPDAVVRVAVDVAQMRAVELGEVRGRAAACPLVASTARSLPRGRPQAARLRRARAPARSVSSHCVGRGRAPSSTPREARWSPARRCPRARAASAEQRHGGERLGGLAEDRRRPGRRARPAPAARPRGGCGCARRARWPRGRPRRPARRRSRCARRSPARERWTSENTRAGGGAGERSRRASAAAAAASAAAFLAHAGELGADHVVGGAPRRGPPASSTSPSWRRRSASSGGEDHGGAAARPPRAACAGPPSAGDGAGADALGDVRGGQWCRAAATRPLDERRARRCARPSRAPICAHRRRAAPRRHGEDDEVHGRRTRCRASARDLDALGQLDAGQVALVLARRARRASACSAVRQPSCTSRPARASSDGERRAHRAGADHGRGAQRRQPAEPLPLELHAGPDPRGHLGGEARRRVLHAREGERRGRSAGCTLTGPDPPAARARARCRSRRSGTTGAPVSSASRPTPRLGLPSEPRRMRVPSGKITTASPRSSSAGRSPSTPRRTRRAGSGRRRGS